MDMFFDEICSKQRVHSTSSWMHRRLHELKGVPLRRSLTTLWMRVARSFDEFQVTDIADALVMKQLFEFVRCWRCCCGYFQQTGDLRERIQRQLFLPFIPCWRRDVLCIV